jgi:two-component system response regulator YesN
MAPLFHNRERIMYKLVIVEDERDVRNRLVSMIAKSESNFEVVAEYETGIDAYDGIISDNPDLILTDIKIPYINGIELSKKVREVLPLVKIIFITGYNEFDYAREAANLGVIGFVSKPVTAGNLSAFLKKAEEALDDEFLTAANLNKLSDFYRSSLPIIRENDLYRLSKMSEVTPAFESRLRVDGVSLEYRYFVSCVFDFDELSGGDAERYDRVFSSLRELAQENLEGFCDCDMFNRYETLCLLLKFGDEPDIKELELRLERIIQRADRHSETPVSVGISEVFCGGRDFASMVTQAARALEYRSVIGGQKVFFFGNAAPAISRLPSEDSVIRELGHILRAQPAGDCLERIELIRERFGGSRDSHYYAATSVLNVLLRACDDLEAFYERFGSAGQLYRRLFESKTEDEIYEFLKSLATHIRGLNDNVMFDNVERNVRRVVAYMEAHFCEPDLSFESLARGVNFSVSYIGALLKKKLGTSFVKLLTEMRMKKAKELLASPELKIIDIAERLGYNDSYYFSHCFKKYTGVSPKEFRNQ